MRYYNCIKLSPFRKFVFFLGWARLLDYVRCAGKYRKLFSFGRKLFFQEIKFIYFRLAFRKFSRQAKSAVILGYGNFFYSMFNQQSFKGIHQHPPWSIRGYKKFYASSTSITKYENFFF